MSGKVSGKAASAGSAENVVGKRHSVSTKIKGPARTNEGDGKRILAHPWLGPLCNVTQLGRLKHGLENLQAGGTPDTENPDFWSDEGVPWIAISDMSGCDFVEGAAKRVSPAGLGSKRLVPLPPGTLLYSMYASLGFVAELKIPAVTNQAIVGLTVNSKKLLTRYAYWQLKALQSYVIESASSNTQDNLNAEKVRNLPFAFPTLADQTRIANFLDEKTARIDALIGEKERLVEGLEEYWRTKSAELVVRGSCGTERLKGTGLPWLGQIPAHWELRRLKTLFRLVTEAAPESHGLELLSLYTNIGVRPRKELEERGNKATSTDGYWLVEVDDLVVNKLLAWMGAIAASGYAGVTSPAYDILRPIVHLNTWYFDALFRSGIYLTEFKSRSRGIMDMRLRLYWEELGTVLVPCPPKEEQDEIVVMLLKKKLKVDDLIVHCRDHISRLREYRSSLISAAVTGQLNIDNYGKGG